MKNFGEMSEGYGFESECHVVVTQDGYRLKVFRVNDPATKIKDSGKPKPVVILQHGLLCAADNWANNGELSPAFLLARAGYDVWLGNSRGSRHSRDHETLDPDSDKAFWEFSFQQMGYFDSPALFNYVEQVTGQKKVAYIGHSQGTTQMFAAIARDPAFWKERISAFIVLAPGLLPFRDTVDNSSRTEMEDNVNTFWNLGIHEFFGKNFNEIFRVVEGLFPKIAENFYGLYSNLAYNTEKGTQTFTGHFPNGISLH